MLKRLKKTINILFFPLAVLFIATSFTGAYFSDSISVTNNKFETGSWGGEDPPPVPTPGIVEISEVFYDAVGTDTGLEWIELFNRGGSTLDLTGYDLYVGHYYTLPTFSLPSNSFVIIHINSSGTNTSSELFEGSSSNMGDTSGSIALFTGTSHNSSTLIDFVEYGASGKTWESSAVTAGIWTAGDFVIDVTAGHSIELNNKNVEANSSLGWHDQVIPTPGS